MSEATYRIGSTVVCDDGPCGEVRRVVVDPVARRLTHLVVEPAHRSGLGRLVPLHVVGTHAGDLRLRGSIADFESLPAAEETDFLPGGSGYESYEAHEAFYWPYFGLEDPQVADASAVVTHERVPMGEVEVRRGVRVHAADGEIGSVEGLVVEPATGDVTHVLLQEGHLWGRKQVAIPIRSVTRLGEGISVSLSKDEIGALPDVGVAG